MWPSTILKSDGGMRCWTFNPDDGRSATLFSDSIYLLFLQAYVTWRRSSTSWMLRNTRTARPPSAEVEVSTDLSDNGRYLFFFFLNRPNNAVLSTQTWTILFFGIWSSIRISERCRASASKSLIWYRRSSPVQLSP